MWAYAAKGRPLPWRVAFGDRDMPLLMPKPAQAGVPVLMLLLFVSTAHLPQVSGQPAADVVVAGYEGLPEQRNAFIAT
jgi:hypothetical protein